MNLRALLSVSAIALSAFAAVVAHGAVVIVTSTAALGVTDHTDWTTLGGPLTQVPSPISTSTTGGRAFTATTANGGNFSRLEEGGVTWGGNFALHSAVLWNRGQGAVTFSFASPVRGAGMQFNSDFIGDFTARIEAFTSGDVSLGAFTRDGHTERTFDNTAIFLGFLSDSSDVSKFTVSFTAAPGDSVNDFAISDVSINAVPEPSTWAVVSGGALLVFAGWRRHSVKA